MFGKGKLPDKYAIFALETGFIIEVSSYSMYCHEEHVNRQK